MADIRELIESDEYKSFRKKQITAIGKHIYSLLEQGFGVAVAQELRGGMGMAREIINFPIKLTNDEELKTIIDQQIKEDMANLTTYLLKTEVLEEE